jgi:hypothetical protein
VGAFAAAEAGSVALAVTTLGAKSNFRPRPQIGRQEFQMNALRLFALTAVVAAFAAPIAAAATPGDAASACTPPSRSIVERRIEEHAGRGMQSLVAFVQRTRPIYQLNVEDAVAWVDSERERRTACLRASAEKPTNSAP